MNALPLVNLAGVQSAGLRPVSGSLVALNELQRHVVTTITGAGDTCLNHVGKKSGEYAALATCVRLFREGNEHLHICQLLWCL